MQDDKCDYFTIFNSRPQISSDDIETSRPVYEHNYDVIHYKLVQNVNIVEEGIVASAYVTVDSTVDGLDEINFDFCGLEVDGVYRDGNSLSYTMYENEEYINIKLDRNFNIGERFTIQVDYHGEPEDCLAFSNDYAFT
ncbi:MAG TPA: hypothetical protein ENI43_03220, partial [Firmicutes bacterium]|nr:hypothetical protein [Bacillota bacterium]